MRVAKPSAERRSPRLGPLFEGALSFGTPLRAFLEKARRREGPKDQNIVRLRGGALHPGCCVHGHPCGADSNWERRNVRASAEQTREHRERMQKNPGCVSFAALGPALGPVSLLRRRVLRPHASTPVHAHPPHPVPGFAVYPLLCPSLHGREGTSDASTAALVVVVGKIFPRGHGEDERFV
jgi:hypothetical protein